MQSPRRNLFWSLAIRPSAAGGDSHRIGVPLVSGVASLLLHMLLLGPVLFGGPMRMQQPSGLIAAFGAAVADPQVAMIATFLESSDESLKSGRSAVAMAPPRPSSSIALARITPLHLLEVSAILFSDSGAEGDSIVRGFIESDPGRAAMLGRYMGQISARIERAWIRPRTPLESDQFVCRAKIMQARSGAVLEIELQECNGNGRWQASLARAIQSASPLPAPPDPDVFSRVVILDFTALPFSPGSDSTGYEPETQSAMN